ncbi:RHS repeat domain-containing protein [Namhaeicola litoreus]|uniref:RHS repeat domain-containing protein n=1 Tax=Namhaeicola litoreus TaxID=1052145 RepID=A0ABW3Y0Q4_9FLAO
MNGIITDYAEGRAFRKGPVDLFSEGACLARGQISYTDANQNIGAIDLEIVEENNYYPFGLEHKGYNTAINGNPHKYMFGGKELQDEIVGSSSFEVYDFGARNYDPALGRWMVLDPLAEKMRRHSPYNYAFNNPIFFIDPDGMMPEKGDPIKWLKAVYKATTIKEVSVGLSGRLKGNLKAEGGRSDILKVQGSVNAFKLTYDLENDSSSFSGRNAQFGFVMDDKGLEVEIAMAKTEKMELDEAGNGKAGSSFLSGEIKLHDGESEHTAEGSIFGKKGGEEKGYVVDGSIKSEKKIRMEFMIIHLDLF